MSDSLWLMSVGCMLLGFVATIAVGPYWLRSGSFIAAMALLFADILIEPNMTTSMRVVMSIWVGLLAVGAFVVLLHHYYWNGGSHARTGVQQGQADGVLPEGQEDHPGVE